MFHTEKERLLQAVERYKKAIHTQKEEDFLPLWAENCENGLISPSGYYIGTESIYRDFLIGKIQAAYRQITLISQRVDVRIVSEEQAVVVFSYSTDCIRRDSGESFGIAGLETQVYCKEKGQWKLMHVHYSVQKE